MYAYQPDLTDTPEKGWEAVRQFATVLDEQGRRNQDRIDPEIMVDLGFAP